MEGYTREQRNKAAGRALGKMSKKMVEGKKLIKKNNQWWWVQVVFWSKDFQIDNFSVKSISGNPYF